jgi:putative restriction endonuclease
MQIPKLLIASHIKPWKASTPNEKTAASNGLLLNAFHDRAFDQGLISIDDDYRIMVNHDKVRHSDINDRWLYDFDGHEISLPAISQPSHEFITTSTSSSPTPHNNTGEDPLPGPLLAAPEYRPNSFPIIFPNQQDTTSGCPATPTIRFGPSRHAEGAAT